MKVLVIGESCKDIFHYGESIRLCPDAPVPVFKSLEIIKNAGMAKNVQRNLESLGAIVDVITNDNWEIITKTRFVDLRTNHMFLRVDENDGVYKPLSTFHLKDIGFSAYDAVVVSDYHKGFLTKKVLKKIFKSHPLVFLDTKKILGSWNRDCFCIKINSQEYEATKHTITNEIKNKLIITRGPNGSEYREKLLKAPFVEVKDTSGAGDTFISGLCYKFILSGDIEASICFANECATQVVQRRGVSVV